MPQATLAAPDLDSFCRLDELGLTATRQVRLRQIRRRTTEDLVLLLQESDPFARLAQLGGLRPRLAGLRTRVDVSATQPLLQRHRMDTEVLRDLLDRHSGIAILSDANDVVTELTRVGLGHSNILPGSPRRASQIRCHLLVQQSPTSSRER